MQRTVYDSSEREQIILMYYKTKAFGLSCSFELTPDKLLYILVSPSLSSATLIGLLLILLAGCSGVARVVEWGGGGGGGQNPSAEGANHTRGSGGMLHQEHFEI